MEQQAASLFSPMVQYGFAGFCFLLLGLVFWMIRKLLDIIVKNNEVIERNTSTIGNLLNQSKDELVILRSIHDKLLQRPCLVREDTK